MIDRSFRGSSTPQTEHALRYTHRSSVYSRRSLDGVVQPQASPVTKATPAESYVVSVKATAQPQKGPVVIDILPVRRTAPAPQAPRQHYKPITPPELPEEEVLERRSLRSRLFSRNGALVGMAVAVFVFGIGVSAHSLITNKHVTQQVQALSNDKKDDAGDGTSGDEKPDETPLHPSAISGYKVAPDLPRKITIRKIGVAARIKPLGVSRDNQLLAPTSIYDAGWYNASAKPGVDAGAVLIDGHVHGPTRPGIFVNLKKLVAGDMIDVERGDGKVIHYKVEKTAQESADSLDMATLMTSIKPGKQGLNLVTCGGKYDTKTGHYESRDEVFAVQVD